VILINFPNFEKLKLIDYYDEFKFYYPNCEMQTKKWMIENIKDDWVIFDCGANIGYYSILFSKLSPKGKIYAFEPTDTIEKLKNNLNFNKVENVEVFNYALSYETINKTDKIYKIWGNDPEVKNFDFITIDDFVKKNNIQKVDLIKIDVDSYDFDVLKGAQNTLQNFNPFIVVELNHALSLRNTSNYEALEWMSTLGYINCLVLEYENVVFKRGWNFNFKKKIELCF